METAREARNEAVAARAYEIYLERQRSGTPGDDLSDWCRAEEEVVRNEERIPRREGDTKR
jgi:hypothetical protein